MPFTNQIKGELNQMTTEELKAKKAELEAKIEAKKLEKEVALLEKQESEIEVVAPDSAKTAVEMARLAKQGNYEGFTKAHADRIALDVAERLEKRDASKKSIYIPEEVKKSFGTKGDDIVALAKDFGHEAWKYDQVAGFLRKPISELKTFQKAFGKRSEEEVQMALKALVSTTSNAGDEYVPTLFSDTVAERLMDMNGVVANLPSINIPSVPYRIPIYTGVPTTYYCTEGSTVTASDPTTDAKDLDPKKLMNRVVYSGEIEEDSIIAILPFVQRTMLESLGNAVERVVLFGDTVTTASTNINLIDGTPTTTAGAASNYIAFDGLIKNSLLGSNGKKKDVNADIVAGFATCMQNMGVGAASATDLICFMNVALTFTFMGNSSFTSYDKLGAKATLLAGQVGSIFGVPLVPSSGIPATNSAGKIPAAGGTLGSFLIVKKSGVLIGFKRRPQIKDNDILQAADQRAFVASTRLDVKVVQPNQTDRAATSYGYNAGL